MLISHIESQIYKNFGFTPTEEQKKVIFSLAEYLVSSDSDSAFILNGFAGTGKTSMIAALVSTLRQAEVACVLMAPTGRAAKVMSYYSGVKTFTIHRRIYRRKSLADSNSKFAIDFNKSNDTVYIVDEASMISDSSSSDNGFGGGNLLSDLFEYVNMGQRNRIIIVGDSAQLPPVGSDFSPALNADFIKGYCNPIYKTLREVVRQAADSGILKNATRIRKNIEKESAELPQIKTSSDVINLPGTELIEYLETSYSKYGKDSTVVITRSNKRANLYNQGIRRSVLGFEDEIESGDMLMVVKNNYQTTDPDAPFDFVANGDIMIVERIYKTTECHGLRFAYMRLRLPDYDDYTMERWVVLDTLYSESPALTRAQQDALYVSVEAEYAEITDKRKRTKAVLADDMFNALQIKFAYALTCHKSQGGQWADVYIDTMLFGDEIMTVEFARWLYTAVTRAVKTVYLVNWDPKFFSKP